jgi:hypothetical protein
LSRPATNGWRTSTGKPVVNRDLLEELEELAGNHGRVIRRRHEPKATVGEWLQKVTSGYYRYHAVPGNLPQLEIFRHRLCRLWRMVLIHRSQHGDVGWERLKPLFDRWIPLPRVLHPYPIARFEAKYPRRKPYA